MRVGILVWVLFWAGCDGWVVGEGGGSIFVDAPFDPSAFDGGPDAPRGDAPREAGVWEPMPMPITCGSVGQVGGHCRTPGNTCASALQCAVEASSFASTFGFPPGAPDPLHPGFYAPTSGPEIAVNRFTNLLCTAACDLDLEEAETPSTGELDTCGACAACSARGSTLPFIAAADVLETLPFGARTGVCRANCTFDAATNGGCPVGLTCDPATLVCVDGCQSDDECRVTLEPTRDGGRVTVLREEGGTCDLGTGRCERGVGSDGVGRVCSHDSECSQDVGVCLDGTCAEYDCTAAGDSADGLCDAGRGVCLARAPDAASLCLEGCNSPMDCNPGNTCFPLAATVGPYTGVCTATCDTALDGPTDAIVPCRSDERCDMALVGRDREGLCRAGCALDTDCPLPDQRCERLGIDGFCRVPDQRCSAASGDADCHFGQRCDLLARPGADGLCVDACTADGDCAPDTQCDLARGLCRRPCTAAGNECMPDTEACIDDWCEQPASS